MSAELPDGPRGTIGSANPLETGQKISLALESVPLAKVLRMIADQNSLNLVMSDKVTGTVSVRLDNVDLRTALDAILTSNGLSYSIRDNIIVVKPQESTDAGELASQSVLLKYLDPITAKKALDSRKSQKARLSSWTIRAAIRRTHPRFTRTAS